jgi:hypothetical protein
MSTLKAWSPHAITRHIKSNQVGLLERELKASLHALNVVWYNKEVGGPLANPSEPINNPILFSHLTDVYNWCTQINVAASANRLPVVYMVARVSTPLPINGKTHEWALHQLIWGESV